MIVPGSDQRPHFAGPSYVRVGSETLVASEPQFQALIAQRQGKAYEILKWKGQVVWVEIYRGVRTPTASAIESSAELIVVDCSSFYVTVGQGEQERSYPLRRIELSKDRQGRLKLEVHPI